MNSLNIDGGFFTALDRLVETSELIVDRPEGVAHPRHPEAIYPVDYGFLSGTLSSDGQGVDVFRGAAVGMGVVAVVFTVDVVKRDVEPKVLVDCAVDEIDHVLRFLSVVLGLAAHLVMRSDVHSA